MRGRWRCGSDARGTVLAAIIICPRKMVNSALTVLLDLGPIGNCSSLGSHQVDQPNLLALGAVKCGDRSMRQEPESYAGTVMGIDGSPLTLASLPPSRNTRWVARRKAEILLLVRGRLLTMLEACDQHGISVEEFKDWQRAYDMHGLSGLYASRSPKRTACHLQQPARLSISELSCARR
jgi:Protein of unknown function (DUF1153)